MNHEAREAQERIDRVTALILARLAKQSDGDVLIAIAALATTMCALAHVSGLPLDDVHRAVDIAYRRPGRLDS